MEKIEKVIKEETEALMDKLGVSSNLQLTKQEEGYFIMLDTEENALLIGKHGDTLSSLELILSLIVAKKLGEYVRITVEVGGYREAREDYLKNLVTRLKESVIETGVDKTVRGLKSWERRVVHLFLQGDPDIITESEGEGRDRVLVVKKK